MLKTHILRFMTLSTALLLSLAFACQGDQPPDIRAERVVMVSYDSVGADLAWRWIGEGAAFRRTVLPGWRPADFQRNACGWSTRP